MIADGLAGAEVVGKELWLYQFRWRKIGSVYRKMLVGVLQRPLTSFTPEQLLDLNNLLEACRNGAMRGQALHPEYVLH
jgi:hypothetical protein